MDPSIALKIAKFILFVIQFMISSCHVVGIGVLGETEKHNLVFQVHVQWIWGWSMGGELQDVEVYALSYC